jgi:hypothetical protein
MPSSQIKHFLIGVLYSGEPDYHHCLRSISSQKNITHDAFQIKWKSKIDAHNELYQTFMQHKENYKYFLKLDADMVMNSSGFLDRIDKVFSAQPDLLRVTTPVYDYFTDDLICGCHAWRSSHTWAPRQCATFTDDDSPIPKSCRLTLSGLHEGRPEVLHCAHSDDFFSFHFGLHRGVKARSLLRQPIARCGNLVNNMKMWTKMNKAQQKHKDTRRTFACCGYLMGIAGDADERNISYTSPHSKELFHSIKNSVQSESIVTLKAMKRRALSSLTALRIISVAITSGVLVHGSIRLSGATLLTLAKRTRQFRCKLPDTSASG